MATEESDRERSCPILDGRDQSVVVAFDVEYDSPSLEDARFRVRGLHILWIAPIRMAHNVKPSLILRLRHFDPLVASVTGQVAFDHISADDDHSGISYTDFQKLEDVMTSSQRIG